MKNRFYALMLFCSALILAQNVNAQNRRYHDFVFDSVTVTTVTYSDTFAQQMDIYQPYGDSLCHRPVIVLGHEGSFTGQSKTTDYTVVALCQNFAKRGYVTASINYRLGNALDMPGPDSAYAENEVMEAIGDGKAAVRYFRKDAYTTNTFRIDTNIIIGGGNSAGAVLFQNYMFITDISQVEPALQTVILANGGLEGNSGNAGYSSRISACLSLAGGLNNPSFVTSKSLPIAHFQGDQDVVVPYVCANAEYAAVYVRLCGLGSLGPLYIDSGVIHASTVYPGAGHVPWDANANELQQVDTISANFLDTVIAWPTQTYCSSATGIQEITEDDLIAAYPNPASTQVTVSFPELAPYSKVQLVDGLGRIVTEKEVSNLRTTFERGSIAGGIYFIRAIRKDGNTIIRKVVFQ
jgi:para-nitrobenzyl esterase